MSKVGEYYMGFTEENLKLKVAELQMNLDSARKKLKNYEGAVEAVSSDQSKKLDTWLAINALGAHVNKHNFYAKEISEGYTYNYSLVKDWNPTLKVEQAMLLLEPYKFEIKKKGLCHHLYLNGNKTSEGISLSLPRAICEGVAEHEGYYDE